MPEPVREPGWYRLTGPGWYRLTAAGCWERVPDEDAETELADGDGWNLVHVENDAVEVPLF